MVQTLILVVHVLASIALVTLVLLQHGKGADAGAAFGSGASQTVFGARGSGSFLTRATALLATVFFATSLSLAYIYGKRVEHKSVTEKIELPPTSTAPLEAPEAPRPKTPPSGPSDVPALPK
jgi:preprotein translocase subunit SecG